MNIYNILYNIARETSFQGIDYTFRHTINNLLNNTQQEQNNNNKQSEDIERTRRKNNLKIQQHISDLENTVLINQECITKMLPVLELSQNEKNKLSSIISKISDYFKEKKKYRKIKSEINSKMLINKQIIEEIKRRRDEGYLMYKEQISNLSESVIKKTNLVKQFQKKFSEVEIFIQRECQTDEHIDKYGKWKTFTIIPFMRKNEDILKKKCFYEDKVNNRNKDIENTQKENVELKEKKEKINNDNDNNNNINVINENNNDENENKNKVKEYYEKLMELNNKKIELMKCRLNIISDINFKKSIIPTFKSKNPISNLDVNLNLIDYKEKEIKEEKDDNLEIEDEGMELAPPIEDNWTDPINEGNISDIEKE